jgi:hypothetical protein
MEKWTLQNHLVIMKALLTLVMDKELIKELKQQIEVTEFRLSCIS